MSLTYKDAGVDIDAGAELVKRIAGAARATHRAEMLNSLGGFAAMTELPAGYEQPVLVTGTDGVGTKLKLAIAHQRYHGLGQDLVAMCVNDVLVCGAEPFVFLDYYATGALQVDVAEQVILGIAAGCELADCSLAGGETAEMPGFYGEDEFDLAGFCVGVVNKPDIIDGSAVSEGDVIIGLPSSGPHSNGYSLVRKIIDSQQRSPDPDRLDALLAPTRIYVKPVLALLAQATVHGMVHITGGGFYENIPRILPNSDLAALIDLDAWQRPEIFHWLQQAGHIEDREMLTTFNCGIGFLLVVPADSVDQVTQVLTQQGEQPICIGRIVARSQSITSSQILI